MKLGYFFCFLSISWNMFSQQPDISFGNQGIITSASGAEILFSEILADGKIVSVGYQNIVQPTGYGYHLIVTRHHPDGSIDNNFGTNGTIMDTYGYRCFPDAVLLQPDQKLVIAATYLPVEGDIDFVAKRVILRYNSDGTPDPGFGNNGRKSFDSTSLLATIRDIALQGNKILVRGNPAYPNTNLGILIRLDSDGNEDLSFGDNGVIYPSDNAGMFKSLTVLENGDIVSGGFVGENAAIRKYHADGSLFTDFGTNGTNSSFNFVPPDWFPVEWADKIIAQPDGKLLAIYMTTQRNGILRLNSDGTVDTSFGTNGAFMLPENLPYSFITDFGLRPDGKIVLAGTNADNSDYAVFVGKLNQDGTNDLTFDNDGYLDLNPSAYNDYFNSINIQQDGKIIVAGTIHDVDSNNVFLLMRIDDLPLSATSDLSPNISIYPNPFKDDITIYTAGGSLKTFQLFDMHGKLVFEKPINGDENIVSPNVSPGIYFYEIERANGKKISGKIMKKN
ncbi:T9SS type A sorting domain-containing protein [Flavobacterium sp.]|uniref:T9SS type A sorting domain-containing protein n=1 Tax=Flavobacterium sp. TaxID=239 RepID=UPI00261EBFB6|nr:T9SS type A sorting domain-containing protein [Flavobacterium sp.]